MNLLYLTITDAGITLDLDKDWHPDLYVKYDTKHRRITFKHVINFTELV